jgi:hypothetical protein
MDRVTKYTKYFEQQSRVKVQSLPPSIKIVSPLQQVANRVKSELAQHEAAIKDKPVTCVKQKAVKRQRDKTCESTPSHKLLKRWRKK